MTNGQANIAPVAAGERIAALDIVRGMAVLGILLANITAYANPSLAYYWPPALPGGAQAADGWVWLAQFVLVDGKMRGLFTILFGAGMLLFIERAGSDGGRLQLRRLFWLGLIGAAHFLLLFTGDILWAYATSGMVCLLALHLSARALLWTGGGWALFGAAVQLDEFLPPALAERQVLAGGPAPPGWPELQEAWAEALASAAREGAALAGPHYADMVSYRLAEEVWHLGYTFAFNLVETIPLVLLGMGMLRAGVFSDAALRRRWRWLALAGVLLGVAMNAAAGLQVLAADFAPWQTQAAFFGILPLANVPLLLGAPVLVMDFAEWLRGGRPGAWLALAGRMALSNYVGTSLVMALVFQGWAGGLAGTMHRLELLVVVALGWALMLVWSRLWLARYRQGPLEWVWRCLTYRRLFANRI